MDLERRSVSCLSTAPFSPVLLLQPCFSSLILTKRAHQHPAAAPPSRNSALSQGVLGAFLFARLFPQRKCCKNEESEPVYPSRSPFFFPFSPFSSFFSSRFFSLFLLIFFIFHSGPPSSSFLSIHPSVLFVYNGRELLTLPSTMERKGDMRQRRSCGNVMSTMHSSQMARVKLSSLCGGMGPSGLPWGLKSLYKCTAAAAAGV